jgi:hypothetical protein
MIFKLVWKLFKKLRKPKNIEKCECCHSKCDNEPEVDFMNNNYKETTLENYQSNRGK